MLPVEVNVQLDKQAIKKIIEQKIEEEVRETFFLVDLKQVAKLLCMSERYITDEFLHDPRVRLCEVRRKHKRWWKYKPLMEAVEEIVDSW